MRHHQALAAMSLLVFLHTAPARAQLVPDGQTNVLDAVTNSISGDLTVGTNGSFTLLSLTNAAEVDVSGDTFIGRETGSFSNSVNVAGPGAILTTASDLYVGSNGWGNQLFITDGGGVSSHIGVIGLAINSSNNQVTVAGSNSAWISATNIYVGSTGSFNLLVVSNRGRVSCRASEIGSSSNSINNQVVVAGSGSDWSLSSTLRIGAFGSFNTLLITNGGTVNSSSGSLGARGRSSNNWVVVTGTNSAWNIATTVIVGQFGRSNILQIDNGGTVNCEYAYLALNPGTSPAQVIVSGAYSALNISNEIVVGGVASMGTLLIADGGCVTAPNTFTGRSSAAAPNNSVIVNGGTFNVTNGGSGRMDVQRGTNEINSGLINADWLVLTNAAVSNRGVFRFNGGTLITRGTTNANGLPFTVGNGTNVATFIMVGGGTHSFADGLLVQTNATLTGTGTINGSVTNCGTIFLTNADLMTFTGPVVNKGVILAVTGTPRFGSTFTNLGTLITTASINVANVSVSGSDIVLQFNTVSNYLHEVQASTNVSSGVWQSLTNGLLGTGSPLTYTDVGGALTSNRTYRVLLH